MKGNLGDMPWGNKSSFAAFDPQAKWIWTETEEEHSKIGCRVDLQEGGFQCACLILLHVQIHCTNKVYLSYS